MLNHSTMNKLAIRQTIESFHWMWEKNWHVFLRKKIQLISCILHVLFPLLLLRTAHFPFHSPQQPCIRRSSCLWRSRPVSVGNEKGCFAPPNQSHLAGPSQWANHIHCTLDKVATSPSKQEIGGGLGLWFLQKLFPLLHSPRKRLKNKLHHNFKTQQRTFS